MDSYLPTILVVEDDVVIAQNILETLEDLGYENIKVAHDANMAIHLFDRYNPDICLFDIHLQRSTQNGIELAENLTGRFKFPFIFMSAFADSDTVSRALKLDPSSYLVKPVSQNQLKVALDLAIVRFENDMAEILKPPMDYIFVKIQDRFVKLRGEDIVFIKADGSYCHIQTVSEKIIVSRHLASILTQLKYDYIVQCHRSYAVNIHYMTAFDAQFIFLKINDNEESIPHTVSYRHNLLHYLPKLK